MQRLELDRCTEVIIDHRGKTPKKLATDFTDSGVPVASALLVHDGILDLTGARFVSDATFEQWMPEKTRRNDVLLTSEAPLGRVALVPDDSPLVLGQRLFCLRGRTDVLDSRFLYYALQSPTVMVDLASRATGTTVFGISQAALRRVSVPVPSMQRQHAIAEVLGALDDKITANSRLVDVSQELLKSVHFQTLTSVATELTYSEIAAVGGGATPSTTNERYWGGSIRWAAPSDITAIDAPYLEDTPRRITESGLAACSSPLYPAGSIFMTSRATIGAFAIPQFPTAVNQGFIVVQPHDSTMKWWLFHEMQRCVPEYVNRANGATFLELPRSIFRSMTIELPSRETIQSFHERAELLHARSLAAVRESRTLAQLRDTLLPALMDGRLQVHDAITRAEEHL